MTGGVCSRKQKKRLNDGEEEQEEDEEHDEDEEEGKDTRYCHSETKASPNTTETNRKSATPELKRRSRTECSGEPLRREDRRRRRNQLPRRWPVTSPAVGSNRPKPPTLTCSRRRVSL